MLRSIGMWVMMTSYTVIYCSPVNRDYYFEMCLATELNIFQSLKYIIYIWTKHFTGHHLSSDLISFNILRYKF